MKNAFKSSLILGSIAIMAGCSSIDNQENYNDFSMEHQNIDIKKKEFLNNIHLITYSYPVNKNGDNKENVVFNDFMVELMDNANLLNEKGEYVLTATQWEGIENYKLSSMIDKDLKDFINIEVTVNYLLEYEGDVIFDKSITSIGGSNGEPEDYIDILGSEAIENAYFKNFNAFKNELFKKDILNN